MVDRSYHRDESTEETIKEQEIIKKQKVCSYCKGPFNKGVEIVVMGAIKGYKGTFCCNECRILGCADGSEENDKG